MRNLFKNLFLIIPLLFILSCGEEESSTTTQSNSNVPLKITINTPKDNQVAQTAQLEDFLEFVTTISIVVEGDDFDTISETFARGQQIVVFVLPGDNRTFFVSLLNSEGQPVCSGQSTIDIVPDEPNEVSIDCFVADEVCDDDSDNNGNGLEDCEELEVCTGAQCDGTNINICVDGVCTEPPPSTPDTEENCTDGIDNDEDEGEVNGGIDCTDLDCAFDPACAEICDNEIDDPDADGEDNGDCLDEACDGEPCDPEDSAFICVENDCIDPTDIETNCDNGVSDDTDELIDCADPDCEGMICFDGDDGSACVNGECQEVVCDDLLGGEIPIDNDGDESSNCNDMDCDGVDCEIGDGTGAECNFNGDNNPCIEIFCFDTFFNGEFDEGIDNDNDGDANCEDFNCNEMPCGTGQVGAGARCTDFGIDQSVECRETACGNGEDDDRDGFFDCNDADCESLACSENGDVNDASCIFFGEGGSCIENDCGNGVDDDGDESTDCQDSNCAEAQPGPNGEFCEPFGEFSCDDNFDNDGDGFIDCQDTDCEMDDNCLNQTPEGQNSLECNDDLDNDNDGLTDCADPSCDDDLFDGNDPSCGLTNNPGFCEIDSGECEENGPLRNCADGVDNDEDGNTDCADDDCDGIDCSVSPSVIGRALCGALNPGECNEVNCTDGVNNDGNQGTDCGDQDCDGLDGMPGPIEALCEFGQENTCDDGFDNDRDNNTDCADPDCMGDSNCL